MSDDFMMPCPECEGDGEIWFYPDKTFRPGDQVWLEVKDCENCNGTGEVYDWDRADQDED